MVGEQYRRTILPTKFNWRFSVVYLCMSPTSDKVLWKSSVVFVLTRAQMGYSRTLPYGGVLPDICHADAPILDPETAFDSFGLELSEYVAKFYLKVTDDVTGRVNGQILDCLSSLASPGNDAAISDLNPRPFVTLCQIKVIQGYDVKKINLEFWVWVVWCMFLGQIFVKNAKNNLEHF